MKRNEQVEPEEDGTETCGVGRPAVTVIVASAELQQERQGWRRQRQGDNGWSRDPQAPGGAWR